MNENNLSTFSRLEGCELAGITFIRDYLQLLFEGRNVSSRLNGYVWPLVKIGKETLYANTENYRDFLCSLIGKKIIGTRITNEEIIIIFTHAEISFSIREEDKVGPEAVYLEMGEKWCVW